MIECVDIVIADVVRSQRKLNCVVSQKLVDDKAEEEGLYLDSISFKGKQHFRG